MQFQAISRHWHLSKTSINAEPKGGICISSPQLEQNCDLRCSSHVCCSIRLKYTSHITFIWYRVQSLVTPAFSRCELSMNAFAGGLPASQLYPPGFEDVPPPPPPLPQPGPALGKGAGDVADKHRGKDHVMFRDLPPPLPADSPPPLPESLPFSQPPLPTDTPPD